jgi:hypothetical protein
LAGLTPEEAMAVRELALRIYSLWPALFYGEHSRLANFKWVMRLHALLELRNWDGYHAGRCLGCMKALAAAMMAGRRVAADAEPSEREAMYEAATRLVEVAARVKGQKAAQVQAVPGRDPPAGHRRGEGRVRGHPNMGMRALVEEAGSQTMLIISISHFFLLFAFSFFACAFADFSACCGHKNHHKHRQTTPQSASERAPSSCLVHPGRPAAHRCLLPPWSFSSQPEPPIPLELYLLEARQLWARSALPRGSRLESKGTRSDASQCRSAMGQT